MIAPVALQRSQCALLKRNGVRQTFGIMANLEYRRRGKKWLLNSPGWDYKEITSIAFGAASISQ